MKVSQRIRAWLQEGEDILTSLLGLIIAISGLIAFADVFSSGRALAALPWLLWVWIAAQAIAVDYQFYITTKRQFTAHGVDPFVYWARWVLIILLGALIVVLGAIFVASETSGASISDSMGILGIPNIVFLYARAAAPVLLLFVIAVDHALDRKKQEDTQPVPAITPDVLNVLIERLDHLSVTVTQLTSPSLPAIAAQAESKETDVPRVTWNEQGNVETVQFPGKEAVRVAERSARKEPPVEQDDDSTRTGAMFASKEAEIAAILQERPGASAEEIAHAANCSERTAKKWIERLL
jgi:DNA-directed RNA polymerase specialized sigma24 family protein